VEVGDKKLKLQLWDTAGQEKFRNITRSFYSNAKGILLVYSINKRESFEQVGYWMGQIKELAPKDVCIILLGNKSDIDNIPIENEMGIPPRCVSFEEGQQLADKYETKFYETSAKEDININESLYEMSKTIVKNFDPNAMMASQVIKRKVPPKPEEKCFISKLFS